MPRAKGKGRNAISTEPCGANKGHCLRSELAPLEQDSPADEKAGGQSVGICLTAGLNHDSKVKASK